ncbi:MAG: HAMP domain-containing protein [Deltaproteobacteria bacterium]|nr:HAMP domain-containing protein [Deltaproteobacteria bacterium]
MAKTLRTVKQKLTALVLTPVAVTLGILPGLWWVLDRQLVAQVQDHVSEAESAFRMEMADDVGDVAIAARLLALDPETWNALRSGDAAQARGLADRFRQFFPTFDILFVDLRGQVVAQIGCQKPRADLAQHRSFKEIQAGKEFAGILRHGCEDKSTGSPPAYTMAVPIPGLGAVFVCLPLDKAFLTNVARKLGIEMALTAPKSTRSLVATDGMPGVAAEQASRQVQQIDVDGREWAILRFDVADLRGRRGEYLLVLAHEVTDMRHMVRNNMLLAFTVTALVGLLALLVGSRVASLMTQALGRVSSALKRMEQQEYVTVSPVRTGDELEDLAEGFNQMVEGLKERDKIRDTFGKYMTAVVADHLLASDVELGGKTMLVTVLFSDIRDFTTLSERMPAQEVVAMLNDYFTAMVAIIMEEGGVVDKYIGDAIMAVFGAPVSHPEDAVRALRAAVRMRLALGPLNERLQSKGFPALRTGIGLHTGSVVAGNIGSDQRMEYTVIGDTVNLASRLESQTKALGVSLLVSEETLKAAQDTVVARFVQELQVKGRTEPVRAYEVLGTKDGAMRDTADFTALVAGALSEPPAAG